MVNKRAEKMKKKSKKTLYGDTIVEAVVAIAIYSIVAVLALGSMSSGLSTAQRNLESTMSRAAIDSQSDTLRYYYESYLAVKGGKANHAYYKEIWDTINPDKNDAEPLSLDSIGENSCEALIEADREKLAEKTTKAKVFALSGRSALSNAEDVHYGFGSNPVIKNMYLNSQIIAGDNKIVAAPLYPRITYTNMSMDGVLEGEENVGAMSILNSEGSDGRRQSRIPYQSEGIWIFPRMTKTGYDFYVRTCWNPVGSKSPSTFTSVVRLYDAN
jgi:type II secretory pathway pseudopilin PulG